MSQAREVVQILGAVATAVTLIIGFINDYRNRNRAPPGPGGNPAQPPRSREEEEADLRRRTEENNRRIAELLLTGEREREQADQEFNARIDGMRDRTAQIRHLNENR